MLFVLLSVMVLLTVRVWGLVSKITKSSTLFVSMGVGRRSQRAFSSMSISTTMEERNSALKDIRKQMDELGVDAFLVPTEDPHMSEYTASYYGRREFITGFTGSAGTAVITKNRALLWTDGRYFDQAEKELKGEWELMKAGQSDTPTMSAFLTSELVSGSGVAIDPSLHAAAPLSGIKTILKKNGIDVVSVPHNLVDRAWKNARPGMPASPVRVHPASFAGRSVRDKLQDVRAEMTSEGASVLVSGALDEVAWLYNVRGADVPCNPVTISYAIVGVDTAYMCIDSDKVGSDVRAHLEEAGVEIVPYEDAFDCLHRAVASGGGGRDDKTDQCDKVWMDGKNINYAFFNSVVSERRVSKESPIQLMKSCKNAHELDGLRACHVRDGAACAEFYGWLDETVADRPVSEVEMDRAITGERRRMSESSFIEPSFQTIAGVNANGAIVHYSAVEGSCKLLTKDDMCLLDSGGQYTDGTTDVTRTFHMGSPTAFQKEMFTRVLKGNIGLDSRVFPSGTAGCMLDAYAREHLWAVGKDYLHGTGHGVGAALNVHEGPQRISRVLDPHPLMPGMVVSNEPGYYESGNFGIRIENLLEVVVRDSLGEFGGKSFLGFDKLTKVPIQKKLIDTALLTPIEVEWLDTYHARVRDEVLPLMRTERGKAWLLQATEPMSM
jgi:Xaa-Pro aminopeptidase